MQAEGGNGGSNDAVYDGRRRHTALGTEQAEEAGRGWVWATPRWMEFLAMKGGGEWVKMRGDTTTTATDEGR